MGTYSMEESLPMAVKTALTKSFAHLPAVFIFRHVGFEKAHKALFLNLMKGFVDHATHVALVLFVGAVNVKIFETDNFIEYVFASCPKVEKVF